MSAVRQGRREFEAVIARLRDELHRQRREVKQLRIENELREAAEPLIHHTPARERFAFVHARVEADRRHQLLPDRRGQYHSRAHRNALQRLEIRQSTGRTGSSLDGAAAESLFATIKAEIGAASWPDRASARRDTETRITHYNQRRLHSTLDYQTPNSARNAQQERMPTAA